MITAQLYNYTGTKVVVMNYTHKQVDNGML